MLNNIDQQRSASKQSWISRRCLQKNLPVTWDVREDSVLELLVVVFDFEGVIGVPLHVIGIFVVLS